MMLARIRGDDNTELQADTSQPPITSSNTAATLNFSSRWVDASLRLRSPRTDLVGWIIDLAGHSVCIRYMGRFYHGRCI